MLLRLPIDLLNLILPFVANASNDPQWQILSQAHRVLDMRKWCTRIQIQDWMSDFNNYVTAFQKLRVIHIEPNISTWPRTKSIYSRQNLAIPLGLFELIVHFPMNIRMKPCLSYCLQRLFLKKVNPLFLEHLNLGSLTCCEIEYYTHVDFQFFSLRFAPNLRSLKLWWLHSLREIDHLNENLQDLEIACKNLRIETLPKGLRYLKFNNRTEVIADKISQCSQLKALHTLCLWTSVPNVSGLTELSLYVDVPSSDITKQIICANANTLTTLYLTGAWSFTLPQLIHLVDLTLLVDTVDCIASMAECVMPNLIYLRIVDIDLVYENLVYETIVSIAWLNGLVFPKLEKLELDIQFNQSQFDTLPHLRKLIVRGEILLNRE